MFSIKPRQSGLAHVCVGMRCRQDSFHAEFGFKRETQLPVQNINSSHMYSRAAPAVYDCSARIERHSKTNALPEANGLPSIAVVLFIKCVRESLTEMGPTKHSGRRQVEQQSAKMIVQTTPYAQAGSFGKLVLR